MSSSHEVPGSRTNRKQIDEAIRSEMPTLPEEYCHEAKIAAVSPSETIDVPLGLRRSETYVMDNGMRYLLDTYIPDQQRTRIPVDMTTGWLQAPRSQLYIEWTKMLMEQGYAVRIIGPGKLPNISSGVRAMDIAESVKAPGSIRLAHIASNNMHILNASDADPQNREVIEPGMSLMLGYSRAAMVIACEYAMQKVFGREIIASFELDPSCSNLEQTIARAGRNPEFILNECIAFWHTFLRNRQTKNMLQGWPKEDYDLSLEHLIPAIDALQALTRGDTYAIAPYTPRYANRHIAFFDGGLVGEAARHPYEQQRYPNIRLTTYKGAHQSVGREDVMSDIRTFFTSCGDQIEQGNGMFGTLDMDAVWSELETGRQIRQRQDSRSLRASGRLALGLTGAKVFSSRRQ